MGYTTTTAGVRTSSTLSPLQLPTGAPIAANLTTVITAEFNLDARAKVAAGAAAVVGPPAVAAIPVTPRSTYGTSINVYDKEGVASPVSFYFEKTATANTWDVFAGLKDVPNVGDNATAIGQISFNASGQITGPAATAPATGFGITLAAGTITSLNPNTTGGKLLDAINVDLSTVTQFGTGFAVSNLTQDGYTSGELTKINIGETGAVTATYSNGKTQTAGQVALMDFRNVQGLRPVGGNNWIETPDSGQPVQGVPGSGKFGALRSGALEESNVDLTAELVNMMTAQRNYQANAQTIKTQDQVMSTLVNLR